MQWVVLTVRVALNLGKIFLAARLWRGCQENWGRNLTSFPPKPHRFVFASGVTVRVLARAGQFHKNGATVEFMARGLDRVGLTDFRPESNGGWRMRGGD